MNGFLLFLSGVLAVGMITGACLVSMFCGWLLGYGWPVGFIPLAALVGLAVGTPEHGERLLKAVGV